MNEEQKQALLMQLQTTRQELMALLAGCTETMWGTAVYAETSDWTLTDLLRHLTGAESSMTKLMALIRDGGEGVPEDFDLNRWNARVVQKSQEKTVPNLLAEMAHNRASLLSFIESLSDDDWDKKGRHGSGQILSIAQICQLIADHETSHMQDIRAILGEN
ncbi:MAG: DinB family protein [Anaerolinea sp.]|nr:DinB family protein [Anaerolinea sp.]